jgi:hypothetical protein
MQYAGLTVFKMIGGFPESEDEVKDKPSSRTTKTNINFEVLYLSFCVLDLGSLRAAKMFGANLSLNLALIYVNSEWEEGFV